MRVSLQGKSWSVVVDLPGFEITQNGAKQGGRRYLVGSNEKTGVVFSVTLERVQKPPDPAECREFLDGRGRNAASEWGARNVKRSEASSMAVLEYVIPEDHGVPLQQGNLFACTVKEDVFVDFHLSKVEYKPENRKLFDAILQTVHFQEGAETGALPQGVRESENVDRNPSDVKAFVRMGEELLRAGKVDGALERFEAAARLDPTSAVPHLRLGGTYALMSKWTDAERETREAVRLDPSDPNSHALLGLVLFQPGREPQSLGEAEQEFQTVLRLVPVTRENGPTRAAAYFELGVIYDRMGKQATAAQTYDRALAENPEDAQVWNNYAWLLATAKDPAVRDSKKAIEYASRAVQAAQGNKAAYLDTLAEAYYADRQFDLAIETEKKAQQLDPQNPAIAEQLKKFEAAKAAKTHR
jgi:tetratricopeptide (TPR) repeat protein